MARRLMFHHYILNEYNDSLVNRFFKLQSRKPVKNDWCLTVEQNLETLNITLSETEIKQLSINSYQRIVKTAIKKEALNYLNTLKKKHSKVLHIKHSKLEMQDYLMPSSFSAEVAKFAFQCRSRMLNVGANYKEGGKKKFPTCPVCKVTTEYDSQQHLMWCKAVNVNIVTGNRTPIYDDLFGENLEKKMQIVNFLQRNYLKRNQIIKQSGKNQIIKQS